MKIRKATTADQEEIYKLVKTVLENYGLKTNPLATDKDISDLENYYFKNNGWFAVLTNKGRIIGSYGIYRIDQSTCELRKMYLLSEFQGKGLGKLMMEDAFKKARELGYNEMFLETNQLLDKAINLYRRYGFVEVSSDHLSDRCDVAMHRKL